MSGNTGIRISRSAAQYSFFFLKPKENADANRYAEELMKHQSVEQVMLVSGEYGFIVKSRIDKNPEGVESFVSQLSRDFRKTVCHYQYAKRRK